MNTLNACNCINAGTENNRGPTGPCDRCVKLLEVQTPFESRLLDLARLEHSDPEAALAILRELYDTYRDRDVYGWLDRSVRAHRAHILTASHRYEESLRELRVLAARISPDTAEFIENQRHIALALSRLGRPDEALNELDAAILSAPNVDTKSILDLLADYAEISSREGLDVPLAYNEAFLSTVSAWGLEPPTEMAAPSLTHAVILAASQKRDAQCRYATLMKQISVASPPERARLLDSYARHEHVGYFVELARRALDDAHGES